MEVWTLEGVVAVLLLRVVAYQGDPVLEIVEFQGFAKKLLVQGLVGLAVVFWTRRAWGQAICLVR